jgi:precorrin-8X/cobalt-precorrin-8 methylmutase
MLSGDGWLVRVRSAARALQAGQVRALAGLARAHGNGVIELTRRANLQLRGVRGAEAAELREALIACGLADTSPEAERAPALIIDPLSGLDAACAHVDEVASALGATLAASDDARALSAKFAVAVDAGSGALREVDADLRLAPARGAPDAIGLFAAGPQAPLCIGVCRAADVTAAVAAILSELGAFARARAAPPRMRDFALDRGLGALRARLGPLLLQGAAAPRAPATPIAARPRLGFHEGSASWFGLGIPFGSAPHATWSALAELAARYGDGELRLTPAREVLLLGVRSDAAAALHDAARELGLITSEADPRRQVIACAGAPACSAALGPTRELATELAARIAPRLADGATLHVSGCAKACASRAAADVTVVLAEGGARVAFGAAVAAACAAPVEARAALGERIASVATPRAYDYERDGAAIYRRSFAIIRAEADLARFSRIEERVAVRLIHTSGTVDLASDVVFSEGFADAAAEALRRGAPILCDAKMVASGVTRARLPAGNAVVCTLDDPRVPQLAAAQRTTRSAAALSLWLEHLDGALVAIGNAPTALFRLLELLDATRARPAAVIGVPVGFVGAAESKDALLKDGRVPALIVRGRRGGSALAAAAINALASEQE